MVTKSGQSVRQIVDHRVGDLHAEGICYELHTAKQAAPKGGLFQLLLGNRVIELFPP